MVNKYTSLYNLIHTYIPAWAIDRLAADASGLETELGETIRNSLMMLTSKTKPVSGKSLDSVGEDYLTKIIQASLLLHITSMNVKGQTSYPASKKEWELLQTKMPILMGTKTVRHGLESLLDNNHVFAHVFGYPEKDVDYPTAMGAVMFQLYDGKSSIKLITSCLQLVGAAGAGCSIICEKLSGEDHLAEMELDYDVKVTTTPHGSIMGRATNPANPQKSTAKPKTAQGGNDKPVKDDAVSNKTDTIHEHDVPPVNEPIADQSAKKPKVGDASVVNNLLDISESSDRYSDSDMPPMPDDVRTKPDHLKVFTDETVLGDFRTEYLERADWHQDVFLMNTNEMQIRLVMNSLLTRLHFMNYGVPQKIKDNEHQTLVTIVAIIQLCIQRSDWVCDGYGLTDNDEFYLGRPIWQIFGKERGGTELVDDCDVTIMGISAAPQPLEYFGQLLANCMGLTISHGIDASVFFDEFAGTDYAALALGYEAKEGWHK